MEGIPVLASYNIWPSSSWWRTCVFFCVTTADIVFCAVPGQLVWEPRKSLLVARWWSLLALSPKVATVLMMDLWVCCHIHPHLPPFWWPATFDSSWFTHKVCLFLFFFFKHFCCSYFLLVIVYANKSSFFFLPQPITHKQTGDIRRTVRPPSRNPIPPSLSLSLFLSFPDPHYILPPIFTFIFGRTAGKNNDTSMLSWRSFLLLLLLCFSSPKKKKTNPIFQSHTRPHKFNKNPPRSDFSIVLLSCFLFFMFLIVQIGCRNFFLDRIRTAFLGTRRNKFQCITGGW